MRKNAKPENSFHHLFWSQQLTNLQRYPKQRCWHPMLICWCLHLRMLSGSAYDTLRNVLVLPTDRTLRDYTHFIKSGTGIQVKVTQQLINEANVDDLEDWQKFVGIIFDEMKIKEVFDKHECKIKGFIDLGDINNHLMIFENSITDTSSHNSRLESEVLGYINEWKANVDKRQGYTEVEKKTMMLSRETIEGLEITGLVLLINLTCYKNIIMQWDPFWN